jgi:ubiquinone/menaquinone biosynthesis C-methylase UbiE
MRPLRDIFISWLLMGWYSRVLLPRLCDFLLGRPFVAKYRRDLLARARGEVLEIGFGTGLNLPHYPAAIRKITVVDPNVGMNRLAQRRISASGITVDQHVLSSERLPFADHTFDTVVSTFTLCSIADVDRAVAEVYRVLKPGGRFLFLEHGLSNEPAVQRWQRRLNGLQMWLADGCHLDRNIEAIVRTQPFAAVEVDRFYMEAVRKMRGSMYRGEATR